MTQYYKISRKGFTLMEILFVLLIIALIVSFAAPAFRAVRYEIKNMRAKSALKKLAEARRTYYQYTKGVDIKTNMTEDQSYFKGSKAQNLASKTCGDTGKTGIPSADKDPVDVDQLFACGFLNWKDFVDLPYTFYICKLDGSNSAPCNESGRYAAATGLTDAGSSYTGNYAMWVYKYDADANANKAFATGLNVGASDD